MTNVEIDTDSFDEFDLDESAIAHIDAVEGALLGGIHSQPGHQTLLPLSKASTHVRRPDGPPVDKWPPLHSTGLVNGHGNRSDRQTTHVQRNASDTRTARAPEHGGKEVQAGPSGSRGRPLTRTSSGPIPPTQYVQRNLFGEVAQSSASGCLVMSSQARVEHAGTKRAKRTKQWERGDDMTGRHKGQTASRARGLHQTQESDDLPDYWNDDEEGDWDSHLAQGPPTRQHSTASVRLPPDSMKLQLDTRAAEKFIYPINMTKRDYQFNIVQRALYDNVLVALPTGLGKTFIAAVVILNFFHWYPQGKIVFVAPTRPLVNQQQMACHGICGLPWDLACEMTGNTSKTRRGDEWQEKRIFYMTPQTLDNDLRTGDVDPKDIVCLVVDEAHRATGNYAYCNIVAQVQAVNPYFRILALTATPGSTAERVQEVIDNLHISLIELRTEEALDIRQYVHKKHEETIIVQMTDDFRHIRDLYLAVMQDNCEALVKHGLLPNADPSTLHPFRVRSVYAERKDIIAKKRWLGATIQETARMAEARAHLDVFSIKMFRSRVQDLVDSMKKQDAKKMKLAQILNLAASIPDQAHPKMTAAVDTILSHFGKEQQQGNASSRVMVFCSLRECVHEIVELLNANEGLKATSFIGQSADKQGRGLTQKQQKEIIEKFKKGVVNVIVATSIGEEGLDIGEVDLIVCYEAVKDSVRMLQRVGRTGRKRDGRIVVLMSEGPESSIWQKSKDTYKGVQQTINAGHSVTLFDDVPRLIPPSIRPVATFEELDQPDFRPEFIGRKATLSAKPVRVTEKAKRRKERLTDVKRNAPEGALMGFLRASSLTSRKGKGRLQEGDDEALDDAAEDSLAQNPQKDLSDDSDDEALERGLKFDRTHVKDASDEGSSASAALQTSTNSNRSPPVTSNSASSSKRGQRLGVRRPAQRLAVELSDDGSSDDVEIIGTHEASATNVAQVLDATRSEDGIQSTEGYLPLAAADTSRAHQQRNRRVSNSSQEFDISWTMDSEALANLTQRVVGASASSRESSPEVYRRREAHPLIVSLAANEHQHQEKSLEQPLAGVALDLREQRKGEEAKSPAEASVPLPRSGDDNRVDVLRTPANDILHTALQTSSSREGADSPITNRRGRKPLKPMALTSSPDQTLDAPKRGNVKSVPQTFHEPSSDLECLKAGSRKRGFADTLESGGRVVQKTAKRKKVPKKRIGNSPTSRALFRFEADRDTDEERRGVRSDSDDEGANTDSADSSDLEHVGESLISCRLIETRCRIFDILFELPRTAGDFQPTQAPRGYNQKSIYQQSLLTQGAPTPFRRKTVGGFVGGRYGPPSTPDSHGERRRPEVTRGNDDPDDTYSVGSFVCDDDEIEYASGNDLSDD